MNNENQLLLQSPLWFYISQNKRPFFVGLTLLVFNNFVDCLTPLVLKIAIDYLTAGIYDQTEIVRISAMFFGVIGTLALTRYGWRVIWGRFHTLSAEDLRNRIFNHYTVLGPQFFTQSSIGQMMSLITNDVQSFRNGIGPGLLTLVDGTSLLIILIPMMIFIDWSWTWKCLLLMPLVPFLINFIMRQIWKNFKIQQERLSEMTGYTQELISGIRTIKTFAQEENKKNIFNQYSKKYEIATNKMSLIDAFFEPVMKLSVASGTLILFYFGGMEVITGVKTVGSFIAFQRYIQKIIWPMSALGFGFSQWQKGMAAFSRIKEQLEKTPDFANDVGLDLKKVESLELKEVGFYYQQQGFTLEKINLKINQGDFIGIVGPVGAGKSTLIQILSRYLVPQKGDFLINGISYSKYKFSQIWKKIKLVPQEAFLFSETVKNNVIFGIPENLMKLESQDQRIEQIVDQVGIKEEIMALPLQFESQLGEKGVNLSGGQKQRLTLARGIIADADVILLDDTLSAVDAETEELIQNELYLANPQQIRVVITHRIKTIVKASQIVVMNKGKIEGIGTHKELLMTSAIYREMAQIQGAEL